MGTGACNGVILAVDLEEDCSQETFLALKLQASFLSLIEDKPGTRLSTKFTKDTCDSRYVSKRKQENDI